MCKCKDSERKVTFENEKKDPLLNKIKGALMVQDATCLQVTRNADGSWNLTYCVAN